MYPGTSVCLTCLLLLLSSPVGWCDSGNGKLTATKHKRILHSLNYPTGYYNNVFSRWEISVSNDWEVVRFNIQNTNIRNSATCNEDYLDIRDGRASYDRQLRRYCGEKKYEMPVTSTTEAIFVTFRSDGKYTDLGFELVYWSVPKRIIELQMIELKLVNYILFTVFGVIVIAITIGLVFIVIVRHRIKKRLDQEALEKEKIQILIQAEKNGKLKDLKALEDLKELKMKELKEQATDGNAKGKPDSEEKAKKRDSANNGSTTRVMKLEPALGSGLLKDSTTTPV